MLDARSDRFPSPAAVVASEETCTSSSAVHARRVAGVDRDTIGRSSAQVFVDGPGGGAPSEAADESGFQTSGLCTAAVTHYGDNILASRNHGNVW